jgi:hypothetical protein
MATRKKKQALGATPGARKATHGKPHTKFKNGKQSAATTWRRSDDLHYTGPQIPVPDLGPDPLDEHGAAGETGILAAALSYATERGWFLFPAPPGEKKSYKSAEHSNGRKWGATNNAEEIRQDFARWPQAGIGLPTGAVNKIWVTEADTPKGHDVDGLASRQQLEANYGPLPETFQVISPTGSLHDYWQWPDDGTVIRNSTSKIAAGIDVRGEGGMVLAPPTVRPGVGSYRVSKDVPIAKAPDWLVELATRDDGVGDRVAGDEPEAEPAIVAAAMAAIPNDDLDWENWNRVAMACWRATGGSEEGFAAFDGWSNKSGKYNAKTTRERWDGFSRSPPNSIGAGTLFWLANEAAPDWQRRYENELMAKMRAANKRGRKQQDDEPQPQPGGGGADDPQPQPSDPQPPPADEVHGITIHWHGEVMPTESRK